MLDFCASFTIFGFWTSYVLVLMLLVRARGGGFWSLWSILLNSCFVTEYKLLFSLFRFPYFNRACLVFVNQTLWLYRVGFLHWTLSVLFRFLSGVWKRRLKTLLLDISWLLNVQARLADLLPVSPTTENSPISATWDLELVSYFGRVLETTPVPSRFKCSIKHKK